jgi:hypothetical protein
MHAPVSRSIQTRYGFPYRPARSLDLCADSSFHRTMTLRGDEIKEFEGKSRLLLFGAQVRENGAYGSAGDGGCRLPLVPELMGRILRLVRVQAATEDFAEKRGDARIGAGKPDLDVVVRGPVSIFLAHSFRRSPDRNEAVRIDGPGEVGVRQLHVHIPHYTKGENVMGEHLGAMQDGAVIEGKAQAVNASDAPIRVGKKRAGRLLDGREWSEMPEGAV